MMILQLANLTASGSRFSGEEPAEMLSWDGATNDIVHPDGPLRWSFTAKLFGTELLIEGKASAMFVGVCARCGVGIAFDVAESICFSVEVGEGESEVDLTSEFRDAILLALPSHPVCAPDCKGLCAYCGKPVAEGSCSCGEASGASLWDALDSLG